MSAGVIISIVLIYFLVLIGISFLTSRGANNETFFKANNQSPWYLVAFGMIGASLSGITFISIPGSVSNPDKQFGYMQIVFGYLIGYIVIAYVLMPLYYRLNVTSIYTYLRQRFGKESHKIGAFYFLISRVTGASIRLLLVANVLQKVVFDYYNIPFEVTVLLSIVLIWIYTFKGGIKTILWTDTLQTLFMLVSLGLTIWYVLGELDFGEGGVVQAVQDSGFSRIFYFDDWNKGNHFVKMFFGGMFIAIGMTGLDQDMMQKNLTCKSLKEAQRNMMSFAFVLVVVNFIFLLLGALLYLYANQKGIDITKISGDMLFPSLAIGQDIGIGGVIGGVFLLGLIAAAYSSADSALTSLTTSVCVDFLGEKKEVTQKTRRIVHILVSVLLFITIVIFHHTMTDGAIWQLIGLAGYTYGPLIGLFFFGILTNRKVEDGLTFDICFMAPIFTYFINFLFIHYCDFSFGASLIIVNALLSYVGLYLISKK